MEGRQLLPHQFAGGDVFHILRDQAGSFLELVERFVEILRLFELETTRKGVAGGLQVFGGAQASRRAPGDRSRA